MLNRRLLLVTGKGGVGKSAVAASLAIAAARTGRRVLALALDGGAGLGAHLRSPRPGPAPQRHGDVHVATVEPGDALDEYLRLRARIPRTGAVRRLFAAVVETAPGVRDTVVIGKAVFESTRNRWDIVVADCPPTGQVLSLLAAPATIAGLVPGGAVRSQAAWMRSRLADPDHSGVVVVATPEELPVIEARAFCAAVETDVTVSLAGVVANKVLADPGFTSAEAGRSEAERSAGEHHLRLRSTQAGFLQQLAADREVPFLFGMLTAAETAERIADRWERS